MGESWHTGVTEIKPNEVRVRGYDIAELMGRASVGQMVYLILRGELPSENVGRVMQAILVSSIDHGATPPSVLAARTVASTGAGLSAAVAAGIMSINQHHGGAIENCARNLHEVIKLSEKEGSMEQAAVEHLRALKGRGKRMPGFGHRIHTADPRTARLFQIAKECGVWGSFIEAAHAVEQAFIDTSKALPINVDGAIAAVLSELGFEPAVMNGLFMIARVPGLVAHVTEERHREKPMRKISPTDHAYDGPAARGL